MLGHPVRHSLSPVLHRAAYAELGLDWSYDAIDVEEAGLAGFLEGLDAQWRGLSLTMPLKRTVVPMVDELVGAAVQAQAANTVVIEGGRRIGYNTDVPGAVAALTEQRPGSLDRAVVVGGGATAASVLLALADLGCTQATLLVRDPARASETVAVVGRHRRGPRVEVRTLGSAASGPLPADVLVSTIPAAAQDDAVLAHVASAGLVFDVLYDPWPTPLAARAGEHGVPLVGGLDLLVHQAARQVELMTGAASAPLAAMRAAGEAALADRSRGPRSSTSPAPAAQPGENRG